MDADADGVVAIQTASNTASLAAAVCTASTIFVAAVVVV